jgi:probable DNA metabolism protein
MNTIYGKKFLSRHNKFNIHLYDKVINQDANLVRNLVTSESRKLYRIQGELSRELCAVKSFTRFKRTQKGILYSEVEHKHNVIDLALYFFHSRFPMFHILLGDKVNSWHIKPNGKLNKINLPTIKALDNLELSVEKPSNLPELFLETTTNKESDELWETFYSSQYIEERRNTKQFNKFLPKKRRDSFEKFFATGSKSLNEYF